MSATLENSWQEIGVEWTTPTATTVTLRAG